MQFSELRDRWDAEFGRWAAGAELGDDLFASWRKMYVGRGDGEIDPEAMPEPWIGDPTAAPGLVLMGLNPGGVTPAFQHREGVFPVEVAARFGAKWSAWASSGPYARDPWEAQIGRNRYWSSARTFVEGWVGRSLPAASVVCFELYPWHSKKWVPTAFNPSDAILNETILEPIQSVGATWAIGKGKAWWESLERLATKPGWRRLGGMGGPAEGQCPSGVAHRQWLVVRAPNGLNVAAIKLGSMPVWPKGHVVADVRSELARIAGG